MNPAIRDERPDVDRVLLAVPLLAEWQPAASRLVLDSLGVYRTNDLDDRMEHLAKQLREHDDLVMKARWCADDPRHYWDMHHDDDWPHGRSLLDWSDAEVLELEAQAAQILTDLRAAAEAIAAGADRLVAA